MASLWFVFMLYLFIGILHIGNLLGGW